MTAAVPSRKSYGIVAIFALASVAWAALEPGCASLRWEQDRDGQAQPHRSADGKLRILHFGDSHTAADNLQIALRSHFQQGLGSGGLGLFLPCTTRPTHCSKGWTLSARPGQGVKSDYDDYLGLPGMLLETSHAGESIQVPATFSTFCAFFLKQPGGGRVRFLVDGSPVGDVDLSGVYRQAVPFVGTVPREAQRLEIRTLGGKVRLLSLNLENNTPGVVYSPLGVVGARADSLLHINETAFNAQLSWESPDLVMLAYGTNESSGTGVDEAAHAARIAELIERIRRAVPAAAILLVGPPDRGMADAPGSLPALAGVIRAVSSAAQQKGVPFLDLSAAMGGAGTAARWAMADPPLAQPDRTHFTPLGYQRLAGYIADAVDIPAASATAAAPPQQQKIYKIRGVDGRITITNDPETVRTLLGQGGTILGN